MVDRSTTAFALVAAILGSAVVARAQNLAYVRASSQHNKSQSPSNYHPINLLDDDPATAWCEGNRSLGEGEEIRIFFKRPQKIDRIVIGPSPRSGRSIRTIKVTDGTNTVRIPLGDQVVEQRLTPPMKGSKYEISILQVGPPVDGGELPADIACLADVMLYFKNRPFGGKASPSTLRYDKRRDRILGRWSGEPLGAPEKFITFALDGTWAWTFEPIMGGRRQRLTGEYRFRGNRLLLRKGETGRWTDVRFKHNVVEVSEDDIGAPKNDYEIISFNTALAEQVAGEYNNAEF